ncbi:MAG: sigma-70 family RNA polymerase sigma factor [Deltaproteobacteria bacterium]
MTQSAASREEEEDIALMERFLDGGGDAVFDDLYARWTPLIHGAVARRCVASRYLGREHIVDGVQYVWLCLLDDDARILRAFDPDQGGRHVRSYVATVARTRATDWLRKQQKERATPQETDVESECPVRSEERYLARDFLSRFLGSLTKRQHGRVESLFLLGRTTREEAERTGDSIAALNSARRDLRRLARTWRGDDHHDD